MKKCFRSWQRFYILNFHRISLLLFFANCFASIVIVKAKEVKCEHFIDVGYWWRSSDSTVSLNTCLMDVKTKIYEANATVSTQDETVGALSLSFNKKIFHLPIDVAESFPNLQVFYAARCSITKISKSNFKGLSKLRRLDLYHNQIETIPSDTFSDCIELERFGLGNR